MPDRLMPDSEEHPVAAGLIALVGVGLAVGLIIGIVALVATRMMGLGGENASAQTTSQESLYLPRPEKTTGPSGPLITLDLTGVYPGGEGAILQVQRFTSGSWQAFPVTVSVSDETFATYVQTSQTGVNRFRVTDTDSGLTSKVPSVNEGLSS